MADLRKIVFIELDGASSNVMGPLLRENKLPNLKRLMDNGASGPLISEHPLISPRLWVSIFSGKKSKKHGVEFFGNSSAMVKCKRIWDIFNERGKSVGVFGSFVTWPPYPVNGFMIPSLFALGTETYPEEYGFFQELTLNERKKGKTGMKEGKGRSPIYYASMLKANGVSTGTLLEAGAQVVRQRVKKQAPDDRYWKRATIHTKISAEFFIHLLKKHKPDFSTIHIHLCDALSHRYWKYYEPEKFQGVDARSVRMYGDVIPDSYIEADRLIGKIMEAAPDSTIVVASDHGAEATESMKTAYRLHVENFLTRFDLRDKVVPANIGLMMFAYFRDNDLMDRIASAIGNVRFKNTGESVFEVLREESLLGLRLSQDFWGREIPGSDEIDLGEAGECSFADLFTPEKMEVSGTHRLEGIFAASGAGIRKGAVVEGATIFDITPTLLALSGLPVARDMDGRVLLDAIEGDFLKDHPLSWIESYDAGIETAKEGKEAGYDEVKERLQSLGYL